MVTHSSAKWIGMADEPRGKAAPLLRRFFTVKSIVRSARLSICGLGYCEAWINGLRVGDHVLDPAQTDYEKRCFYVKYDVREHLGPGDNAIGVMLGDGFFNQDMIPDHRFGWFGKGSSYGAPRLWAELEIRLESGERYLIVTDQRWKCATAAIVRNNPYAGECYDARLEIPGWASPEFNDLNWKCVEIMPPPGGVMEEQTMPSVKKIQEINPLSIAKHQGDNYVVDMGQNFAGWARIRIQAPKGTEIRMRFAEEIFPDGRIDTASTGVFATTLEQTDTYICRGKGIEVWEPRFTYHGFRYVEVTGWPGTLGIKDITGIVVHTALPQAGAFECSDARINQLHRMVLWTHRSNVHGIPEDCPARERCGWLGDANIICECSIYNFQGMTFWEKYLDDIETTRALNDGLPAMVSPGRRCTRGAATPDWMAAFIQIPWYLYLYYGNKETLQRHWDGMRAAIEYCGKKAEGWILSGGLGDWCDPGNSCRPTYTEEVVTTTMWFWKCSRVMAKIADLLRHKGDAGRYHEWEGHIRGAFQARFYDRANHTFGSQTADAMALYFQLVPSGEKMAVINSLVKNIRETHNCHHTVGIMGLRFLFEVLTRNGHGDTALTLMHQNTYPSFGDLIKRGATTLWEYWGEREVDEAEGPRSLNHPMMGGFGNWFYNTLAGIRPDPARPGFKHFFLEPHPIPGLAWARAHHDSPQGRIVSKWHCENRRFQWSVTVPPGSTATTRAPYSHHVRELGPGTYLFVDKQVAEGKAVKRMK
ncbi:MAG: family 78 glycoside hydrolase catalytic domain [Candidatus Omnitrophota bacterium]